MNAKGYLAVSKWRQGLLATAFVRLRARGLFLHASILLSFFFSFVAQATPSVVRVDGSIFDSLGAPITASKDIQIKAYDAATAGSLLWSSDVYTASVNAGKFTINMNAASGSTPSLVTQVGTRTTSQGIYFQIEVDSGAANGSMDSAQIVLPRIRAKGTMFALNAAEADGLRGVTATAAEMNYLSGLTSAIAPRLGVVAVSDMQNLAGVTAGVQAQINSINAALSAKADSSSLSAKADLSAVIAKVGDTMTGDLGLSGSQATPSRALVLDSSRRISSSAITSTELGYLSGVTSNIATSVNGLSGNIQSQINTINSNKPDTTSVVLKAGDTMTGGLGLAYAAVTPSRFLMVDSTRKVSTSANAVTDTEFGYLSGVTQAIQTQLNAKATAANHILKAGDTMTGDLGLAGSQATASRALVLDSSRRIASSSVTDVQLAYLTGLTTALGPNLNGLTANVQTQLNDKLTVVAGVSTQVLAGGVGGAPVWGYGAIIGTSTAASNYNGSGTISTTLTCEQNSIRTYQNNGAWSGNYNYTLPSAASCPGKIFVLSRRDANYAPLRVLPPSGEFIDGATLKVIGKPYQTTTFIAINTGDAGTGWTAIDSASMTTLPVTTLSSSASVSTNNTYVTTSASLVGVTLPTYCYDGDRIKIVGVGTGGWRAYPNSGQISYGGSPGSPGGSTSNYIQSINYRASVELVCRSPVDWSVSASDGLYTGDYLAGVSTFTSNGVLTIPNNVTRVVIKAWGAGGGGGAGDASTGGGGGGGAFAGVTTSVIPGQQLVVVVGTGGSAGSSNKPGGGGAYSAVYVGPYPILIAGGGGGGGAGSVNTAARPAGGGGGGVCTGSGNGEAGGGASGGTFGGGATLYSGGAAGGTSEAGTLWSGGDGAGSGGGAGGTPGGGTGGNMPNLGGGGGGGGFYGGGGGAGSTNNNASGGGGGGGGSSGGSSCTDGVAGSGTTAGTAGNNGDSSYAGNAGLGGSGGTTSVGTSGTAGRVVISF